MVLTMSRLRVIFLGYSLRSTDVKLFSSYEGIELESTDGKVRGTIL